MQVTVLGTGTIGSTVAYNLATRGFTVRCTDIDEGARRGHATDITHSLAHASHPVGRAAAPEDVAGLSGDIEAVPPESERAGDADCFVVTASAPRPAGANQRGGRLEWLEANLALAGGIGAWLRSMPSRPVVVVTNPVDVVTYELSRQSEWPSHCFLGYSLSETARMAHVLARKHDVPYEQVSCPVLGEHGEGLVPVFSRATVGGESIDPGEAEREDLLDAVREAPYTVMSLRGASESSRWVTGRGVALVVQCLQAGGPTAPVGLSTPLASAYGYENVALSVPVRLGTRGVDEIVEWDLSPWEQRRLDDAARAVAANIPE